MTKTTTLLLSLILVVAASAATPKPSPTPQRTPADSSSPASTTAPTDAASPATTPTSPAGKPSPAGKTELLPGHVPDLPSKPTPSPTPDDVASPSEVTPAPTVARGPSVIPNPVLYLMFTAPYTANGKNWIRYRYDVANKADYPAEMFAAAPTLPPCGLNTNASRTWVDFFDSTGKRLYGFCALGKPADLGKIWFALEEGVIPPSYVYIELNDRQTGTKYKSNLADTTM